MKKFSVEPGITVGLENMPADVVVVCLSEAKLDDLINKAVFSGMLLGGGIIFVGLMMSTAIRYVTGWE